MRHKPLVSATQTDLLRCCHLGDGGTRALRDPAALPVCGGGVLLSWPMVGIEAAAASAAGAGVLYVAAAAAAADAVAGDAGLHLCPQSSV